MTTVQMLFVIAGAWSVATAFVRLICRLDGSHEQH